jgi:hypothetical protein
MSFSSDFYTFSTFKQSECLSKTKDIIVNILDILILSAFLTILFLLFLFILTEVIIVFVNIFFILKQKNFNYINNSTNFETDELFIHEDLI